MIRILSEEAARLLEPLVRDEADIVIGSRRSGDGETPSPGSFTAAEMSSFASW